MSERIQIQNRDTGLFWLPLTETTRSRSRIRKRDGSSF